MTSDGIHSIRLLVTTIYTMCKRVPIYTSPRSAFTTTSLRYALYRSLLHIEKNICGTLLMYHSTVVYLILMHYHVLTLPTKKKKESACEKKENFKRRKNKRGTLRASFAIFAHMRVLHASSPGGRGKSLLSAILRKLRVRRCALLRVTPSRQARSYSTTLDVA